MKKIIAAFFVVCLYLLIQTSLIEFFYPGVLMNIITKIIKKGEIYSPKIKIISAYSRGRRIDI